MNIALLQMAKPRMETAKPVQSSSDSMKGTDSFDKVLNDTVSSAKAATAQKETEAVSTQEPPVQEVADAATEMAEAPTLKTVFDLLGVEYDESMMFIQLEGELIPMEEMMPLENLTAMLGVTPKQLEAVMQQLIGQEAPLDDVWAILEQAPALLAQVTSVLKGESTQVTPKEAAKVVEFLKLAHMVGMKTDNVYQHEFQLNETQSALQSLLMQLQPVQQETAKPVAFEQAEQQQNAKPIAFKQAMQQQEAANQTEVKQETAKPVAFQQVVQQVTADQTEVKQETAKPVVIQQAMQQQEAANQTEVKQETAKPVVIQQAMQQQEAANQTEVKRETAKPAVTRQAVQQEAANQTEGKQETAKPAVTQQAVQQEAANQTEVKQETAKPVVIQQAVQQQVVANQTEVKQETAKPVVIQQAMQQQEAANQTEGKQETAKPVVIQQAVQQQVVANQTQVKQETDTTHIQGQQQHNTVMVEKIVTITLPAERPAQSETLIKEIQNLINRSQLANSQGTMRLVLKLFPENLGQIRIEIMQKDGMMQARLLATTASGKELLDSNLHQLKTAFVAQNIQMERIDVAQALQDAERSKEQGFFNNFSRQRQEEPAEKNDDEEQQSFDEFLAEEFFNEEV